MAEGYENIIFKTGTTSLQQGDWYGNVWLGNSIGGKLISVYCNTATVEFSGVTYVVVPTVITYNTFNVQFIAEGKTPLWYTPNHSVSLTFTYYLY